MTPLNSTGDPGYRNALLTGIGADYSNSPFDVRHRFSLNGSYQVPYGVGRRFGNRPGILDEVLGGWTTSLTFVAQTGQPFTIGPNITTVNGANSRVIRIRDPFKAGGTPDPRSGLSSCPARVRTTTSWFNPCAFINPPAASAIANGSTVTGFAALAYLGGTRNTVYGPGYERINGSLFKNFTIFREASFQLRADYFNLLNTPAYGNPGGANNTNSQTTLTTAGAQITANRSLGAFNPDSRFFQFAAKINF